MVSNAIIYQIFLTGLPREIWTASQPDKVTSFTQLNEQPYYKKEQFVERIYQMIFLWQSGWDS